MSKNPDNSIEIDQIPAPASGDEPEGNEMEYQRLPPNLLRIRADDNDKKTMVCYWVIFVGIFMLMTLLMFAIPKDLVVKNNASQLLGTELESCKNPSALVDGHFTCHDFSQSNPSVGLILLNLLPAHQFMVIFMEVLLVNATGQLNIAQEIQLEEYRLTPRRYTRPDGSAGQRFESGYSFYNNTYNITINKQNSTPIVGYRKFFAYEYDVEETPDRFILLTFSQSEQLQNVETINMVAVLINPRFSIFTILLRLLFFFASVAACIVFIIRYRTIPKQQVIIQQKLVAVQSVLLIFFNDPFYGVTILAPNGFFTFYSVFVVVNFLIFVLLTWIIFIERVLYENGQKDTELLNYKKIVYGVVIYILALVVLCLVAFYHIQEIPILTQYDLDTARFSAIKIITFIVVIAGFIYIFVQYVRSCLNFSQKLWRNQLFLYFVICFIVVAMAVFFFGGYHIFSLAGRRILLIFTMANVYTFYMQHMYSIANSEKDRIKSGQLYYDDSKEARSIMSEMNYGAVALTLDQKHGGQPMIRVVTRHSSKGNSQPRMVENDQFEESNHKQESSRKSVQSYGQE